MDQTSFSAIQRQCVLAAFRKRAGSYRSQLTGDARTESRLSPEQHVEIQEALITRNYLNADADGEFGPMTRAAIKRYQAHAGFPQSEFLTAAQHHALLQGGSAQPPQVPPPGARPSSPEASPRDAPPTLSPHEARIACQSSDANERLAGCTVIIDANGFGSQKSFVDALDGRCWAFNDLQQYERGLADCQRAIKSNSQYSYAHHNLAVSLFGLGQIQKAIAAYTKAIELKPNFVYSYASS
jgi:tetratricopeptide (TPR) repeat protein